jgi:protein involved in polysaccharide export with SLBB domain
MSMMFCTVAAPAQTLDPETLKALQALKKQRESGATEMASPVDMARQRAEAKAQKARPPSQAQKTSLSRLEKDYGARAGEPLHQFGYGVFSRVTAPQSIGVGRIPENYILGVGDELILTFHGSTQRTIITRVDREGRLIVPDLLPVQAAGRSFAEVRDELEQRTANALLGTEVFVSVGSVRMMTIMVLGEVKDPGMHRVTSLANAFEAIATAGGVKKTGSLRRIRIKRGGSSIKIDLYKVLTGAQVRDLTLFDGDQIIVPVIGDTVAVHGEVKRPGIYELAAGQNNARAGSLVQLAGGTLRPNGYAYTVTTFDDQGRQLIKTLSKNDRARNGDIIAVRLKENVQLGGVMLVGHVRVPGPRSLAAAPSLSKLIRDVHSLGEEPYLPFAVINRVDPVTRARVMVPVDLEKVLAGTMDIGLKDDDEVIVLGARDIAYLSSQSVRQAILSGQAHDTNCAGLRRLAQIVKDTRTERFATAVRAVVVEAQAEFTAQSACPKLFNTREDLLPFLLEHVISVTGAVRRPGAYPVTGEVALSSLAAAAGGLINTADLTSVEVLNYVASSRKGTSNVERRIENLAATGLASVTIGPGSGVRFNSLVSDQEKGAVLMAGEFRRPGLYTIRRGERLSEVIARAGGLTEQAYPYGAVFTRKSVQKTQQEGFRRTAREINMAIAAKIMKKDSKIENIMAAKEFTEKLNTVEVVGRVVVEADPTVLQVRRDLDIILEPGDNLFIPKRPSFVSVIGDVLNPGAMQFIPGKKVRDYIRESGDFQRSADKKRIFVVYPNGEAKPVRVGAWTGSSNMVPPGSTIVVPIDINPLDALSLTTDITKILSQLAISAASIAVINR